MRLVRTRPLAAVMAAVLALSSCTAVSTSQTTAPSPVVVGITLAPATATPAQATPVPATAIPATPPPATETLVPPPTLCCVTAPPTATPASSLPPATPDSSVSGHLTVLDWAGYDAKDFWTDYATLYPNASVDFEIGASDSDIYSKMAAGDQADIFHPYTGYLQFYVDQGLVQPIDTSRLSNWSKVPDSFKVIGQINGVQYFIPWDWGFTSILYNTKKVTTPIDSWAALMDPKYKGHISMWDDGPGAVTVSSYIHGWDETQITADQLAQIKQEWIAQKALNLFYWQGEPDLVQGFKSGDVWVAYAWQGAYATLLGAGKPVAYADPIQGRNSWVGVYGIRKDSPNTDLAYRFLDAKLADATGQNVVNEFYYGSVNSDVMAGITDPTLKKAFGINDPTILQRTNFTPNVTDQQRNDWGQMWTEVKAAP